MSFTNRFSPPFRAPHAAAGLAALLACIPPAVASQFGKGFEQRVGDDPRLQKMVGHDETQRGATSIIYVGSGASCDTADLASALTNAPDGAELRLQNETFSGNFGISSKNLVIVGGFEDCTATSPAFSSTLDGTDNGGKTVLDIFDAQDSGGSWTVELENLTITNGNEISPFERGGGLHIEDDFFVALTDVTITGNQSATAGGGIQLTGNTGTTLFVFGNTVIRNNSAADGGGIACIGPQDQLGVIIDSAAIFSNSASRGGGIFSDNCLVASHAGGFLGGIFGNQASLSGGGIAALGASEIALIGSSPGFLVEGDPENPALLAANDAASIGGGALIQGNSSMAASDAVIENNSAGNNGGGINVTESTFTMERFDGTTCSGERCSRLRGNSAQIGGGISVDNPADGTSRGATGTASKVQVTQTFISGNRATGSGSADDGSGAALFILNGSAYLEGNVMFGNSGDNLIRQQPNTSLALAWSTVADNTSNGGELLLARGASSGETRTRLLSSILQNQDGRILALDSSSGGGFDLVADCLVASDLFSMPGVSSSVSNSSPGFIDAAADDYHLRHDSVAVDFCPGSNVAVEQDMDEQDRGRDVIPGPAFDAGADEQQGEIFIDGFEG